MKKHKKFKDEYSSKDSKRKLKKTAVSKKKKLNPDNSRPPKYRNYYLTEEE